MIGATRFVPKNIWQREAASLAATWFWDRDAGCEKLRRKLLRIGNAQELHEALVACGLGSNDAWQHIMSAMRAAGLVERIR